MNLHTIPYTTYIPYAIIAILLIYLWQTKKQPATDITLHPSPFTLPTWVITLTQIGGILLACTSLYWNWNSAYSLGTSPAHTIGLIAIFTGLQIGALTGIYWTGEYWRTGNGGAALATAAFACLCFAVSIWAGNNFLSNTIDTIEQTRLVHSDQHQDNRNNRNQHIQNIQHQIINTRKAASTYMQPNCTPKTDRRGQPYTTRASQYCTQIAQLQAELTAAQATPLQTTGITDAQVPVFKNIARFFQTEYETVRADITMLIPIFCDLGAGIMLFLASTARRRQINTEIRRPRESGGPQPATIVPKDTIPQAKHGGYITKGGLVEVHDNELILNPEETQQYMTWLKTQQNTTANHTPVPPTNTHTQHTSVQSRVGTLDKCDYCGGEYEVMTWNQRFCHQYGKNGTECHDKWHGQQRRENKSSKRGT